MRRYTERRSGVPLARTTVRISGERQIATFEAMCAATGREPHELASDIVLAELWAAGNNPGLWDLARQERQYRIGATRGTRATPARPSTEPPRRRRGLSPDNEALTGRILAILADEGALPISTTALLDKLNALQPEPALTEVTHLARTRRPANPPRVSRADLLRMLNRLARLGMVEKIRLDDMRCLYWRAWDVAPEATCG
jgi:hypothetical protein